MFVIYHEDGKNGNTVSQTTLKERMCPPCIRRHHKSLPFDSFTETSFSLIPFMYYLNLLFLLQIFQKTKHPALPYMSTLLFLSLMVPQTNVSPVVITQFSIDNDQMTATSISICMNTRIIDDIPMNQSVFECFRWLKILLIRCQLMKNSNPIFY